MKFFVLLLLLCTMQPASAQEDVVSCPSPSPSTISSSAKSFFTQLDKALAKNGYIEFGAASNYSQDHKLIRKGSIDAIAGYRIGQVNLEGLPLSISVQGRYSDKGKQPYDIKNINKTISFDLVGKTPLGGPFSVYAFSGIVNSSLGYNGSGIPYRNRSGFSGYEIGSGIDAKLTRRFSVFAEYNREHYRQVDKRDYEYFGHAVLGLAWNY